MTACPARLKVRLPLTHRFHSMKAILCTRFGGPDDLEYGDLPDPQPGSGEVVVAIKAAALNFFDTLIIAGKYQFKPPFPFSPASEFAGVVESVGPGVRTLAPGDHVILSWAPTCGRCHYCVIGRPNLCERRMPGSLRFT